ncbi:MAG: transglycosylase domain-containing protein, partial [Beijerinckiaceae bacterium]
YFGKDARQVTLPEAAVLAGLMKAPVRYAPTRNPEAATARAALVLTAMAQEGHITENMAKVALANPARAVRNQGSGSINYVADFVMDRLDQTLGAIDHDLVVETTIDPAAQKAAERALTRHIDKYGSKYRVSQGALVALDPNGGIRALVGGRDYAASQFNRAVAARRQPGSAFKPFVYLTALERGLRPDTRRLDGPLNIRGWRPENAHKNYYGNVTLSRALALSLNTVAVRLAMEVGPKSIAATARRLGVESPLKPNASLALGTSETNLLEMTGAYAVFANGGIGVDPHVITRVRRTNGRTIFKHNFRASGRVIAPQYVAMLNSMLQETLLTGTARKAELPGWQAAGKTGTTQDYRDAWFIGYTSQLVTGVWLGNDDSSPTKRASGGNLPVEIWSDFMRAALSGVQPDRLPSGNWRDPATDNLPPPLPPADVGAAKPAFVARPARDSGAPMTINPAGAAINSGSRPRSINDLIPPGRIGNDRTGSIPRNDRSLLQRMLGG